MKNTRLREREKLITNERVAQARVVIIAILSNIIAFENVNKRIGIASADRRSFEFLARSVQLTKNYFDLKTLAHLLVRITGVHFSVTPEASRRGLKLIVPDKVTVPMLNDPSLSLYGEGMINGVKHGSRGDETDGRKHGLSSLDGLFRYSLDYNKLSFNCQ